MQQTHVVFGELTHLGSEPLYEHNYIFPMLNSVYRYKCGWKDVRRVIIFNLLIF